MKRKMGSFLLGIGLAILLAAPPAVRAQGQTVEAGYLAISSFAPFFIAVEKGFFKDEGVDVHMARFANSGEMFAPMASGKMDVGSGGIAAGLFNSIAKGIKIKVVADKGGIYPGASPYQYMVVRKSLANVIKTYADLKGHVMLYNSPGSPVRYYGYRILRMGGLTEKDITIRYVDFARYPLALEKGEGDVGVIVNPHGQRAIDIGAAVPFATTQERAPFVQQVAAIFYSGNFIKNKFDLARRFMIGYVRATHYYNDHARKGEVAKIVEKYTGIPRATLLKVPFVSIRPDASVDVKSIMDQEDFWASIGKVERKVKAKDVVDLSFERYANHYLKKKGLIN